MEAIFADAVEIEVQKLKGENPSFFSKYFVYITCKYQLSKQPFVIWEGT
jgi:hypothetical protein